jgi:hypothetical protein
LFFIGLRLGGCERPLSVPAKEAVLVTTIDVAVGDQKAAAIGVK